MAKEASSEQGKVISLPTGAVCFGPFRFDPSNVTLSRGDAHVHLPPRALGVLEYLVRRPGKLVSKDELLEAVWADVHVTEDALTQAISLIRQALGDDPRKPEYVETVPRLGYRFVAEVSPVSREHRRAEGAAPAVGQRGEAVGLEAATPPGQLAGAAVGQQVEAPPALAPDTELGKYRVLSRIGAGAMGEVWRARDSHLSREVAIKVVPAQLAEDHKVIGRFRREARLLAQVNHPNIATIYGVEEVAEAGGLRFIVMELLEGESLEEKLARGPLPVDEALEIGHQVAEALEAAHEKGIIHRDLKPANVVLVGGQRVKVLDFGLAKEVRPAEAEETSDQTSLTRAGVMLGTAPYMSPEQVRGRTVDKRTDIWAFGCLLFELLTGQGAFRRDTVADTLAAILDKEPDWTRLAPGTPREVRRLLGRCLAKDPRDRLHDIADARIEIEEALGLPGAPPVPIPPPFMSPPLWRRALPWGVAAAALVITVTVAFWATMVRTNAPPLDSGSSVPAHFPIQLPAGLNVRGNSPDRVAISPDGTKIAYRANSLTDAPMGLYLHDLDELEPAYFRDLPEGFFSPDGNWMALFQDATLEKVSLSGGTLEHVCDLPAQAGAFRSGTWTRDGWIVFRLAGQLWRCPEGGGDRELIATPDAERREQSYWWPHLIPNRNAVVFGILMADGLFPNDSEIAVLDLGTLEITRGIARGNVPYVLPTGHLLYADADRLFAQAFDLDTYQTYGPSAEVLTGIDVGKYWNATYTVAENGTLVYVPSVVMGRDELVWVDEQYVDTPALSEWPIIYTLDKRSVIFKFQLSHDRRLMAADIGLTNQDIATFDLSSGRRLRPLVRDRSQDIAALLPGDAGFFFHEHTADGYLIYRHDFSGAGEPELLDLDFGDYSNTMPISVSPDGRWMTVQAERRGPGADILLVSLEGRPSVEPWLATEASESWPLFSPDGRWIAYLSDLTGRQELYVREVFAAESEAVQVTFNNPYSYAWSPDGNALYYFPFHHTPPPSVQSQFRFGKVSIGPDGEPGEPQLAWLFDDGLSYYFLQGMWGIGADGRLLVNRGTLRPPTQINVHINWFDKVKELVPTSR